MWEESKHPRDDDGRFTAKNGTPAEHKRLYEKGYISEKEHLQGLHNRLTDKDWENSLSQSQKDSIRKYTAYSSRINELLRNNRNDWDNQIKQQIEDIDNAIDKYNLKEPITIYRRVPYKFVQREYLRDKGFSSCSISKKRVLQITQEKNKDVVYIYELSPQKGLGAYINNLADDTHKDDEFEFLIGRSITFIEVDSFKKDGILYIKWRLEDE